LNLPKPSHEHRVPKNLSRAIRMARLNSPAKTEAISSVPFSIKSSIKASMLVPSFVRMPILHG